MSFRSRDRRTKTMFFVNEDTFFEKCQKIFGRGPFSTERRLEEKLGLFSAERRFRQVRFRTGETFSIAVSVFNYFLRWRDVFNSYSAGFCVAVPRRRQSTRSLRRRETQDINSNSEDNLYLRPRSVSIVFRFDREEH